MTSSRSSVEYIPPIATVPPSSTSTRVWTCLVLIAGPAAVCSPTLGAINFEVQQPTSCKVLHKWEPTTRT